MNSEFKFDLSSPPPSEEEIVAARKAQQAQMSLLSRRQLGFFAGSWLLLLVSILLLQPWSGVKPGALISQVVSCLYLVFSFLIVGVLARCEIGANDGVFGYFVTTLKIFIPISFVASPILVFLEYSLVEGGNFYGGLSFLVFDVIVFIAVFIYWNRLLDRSYAGSVALAGLEPIALEHCPEALAWRNEHAEIANYQAQAAAQGRMLTEGEYFAMSELVARLNDEKAARERMAELEKACDQLRLPPATAKA